MEKDVSIVSDPLMACPVCKGNGFVKEPRSQSKKDLTNLKHAMARTLIEKGYSYREVMRFLDYKSPRAISRLLALPGNSVPKKGK